MSGSSGFAAILPFMEQSNPYTLYDFSKGNSDPVNLAAVSQRIPTYLCPSCVFARDVPIRRLRREQPRSGHLCVLAPARRSVGREQRRDRHGNGAADQLGVDPRRHVQHAPGRRIALEFPGLHCGQPADTLLRPGPRRLHLLVSPLSAGHGLHHARPVQSASRWPATARGSANFRSNHPGGVNMANVDGSARFWPQTVNHQVLDAAATRTGGEVFSLP